MWKRQRWSRWFALPPRKYGLLAEAAMCLALARLALLVLPFPRIGRYLGQLRAPGPQTDGAGSVSVAEAERRITADVRWAVDRAARLLPFRTVCLPRALAAWQMLHIRHIPSRLHFGALGKQPNRALETHAWLDANGIEVTGYPLAHEYIELGYFTR
jgi:hypothetical protein